MNHRRSMLPERLRTPSAFLCFSGVPRHVDTSAVRTALLAAAVPFTNAVALHGSRPGEPTGLAMVAFGDVAAAEAFVAWGPVAMGQALGIADPSAAFGFDWDFATSMDAVPGSVWAPRRRGLGDFFCSTCSFKCGAAQLACLNCKTRRTFTEILVDGPSGATAGPGATTTAVDPLSGSVGGLGATSAVLMINSLDMYTTRETVMRVMAAFGPPVKDVRLAMERGSTRLNRGFGFVEFHSVDDAASVLGAAERSGLEIDRRRVAVSYGRGLGGSYGSDPAAVALGNMAIEAATQWGSGGAAPSRKAAQAPVGMSMGAYEYEMNAAHPDVAQALAAAATTTTAMAGGAMAGPQPQDGDRLPDTNFCFSAAAGYYYDPAADFYYDHHTGLYYHPPNNTYYTFSQASGEYEPLPLPPVRFGDAIKQRLGYGSLASAAAAAGADEGAAYDPLDPTLMAGAVPTSVSAALPPPPGVVPPPVPPTSAPAGVTIAPSMDEIRKAEKEAERRTRKLKRKFTVKKKKGKAQGMFAGTAFGSKKKMTEEQLQKWNATRKGEVAGEAGAAAEPANVPEGNDDPIVVLDSELERTKGNVCLLCNRKLKNATVLARHIKESKLHRKNLGEARAAEVARRLEERRAAAAAPSGDVSATSGDDDEGGGEVYRDRAKERRLKYGQTDTPRGRGGKPPASWRKKKAAQAKAWEEAESAALRAAAPPPPSIEHVAATPLGEDNIGSQMLKKMGWVEGQGLGRRSSGRVAPIAVEANASSGGIGSAAREAGAGAPASARTTHLPYVEAATQVLKARAERVLRQGARNPLEPEDDGRRR